MFHSRTGMRDEQAAQLQELNSRLGVYLSRVRQLEQENQFLVEEIESLRTDRELEWKRGYEAEISQLRRQVEDLTLEKSRAEIERDSLWQEFQLLQQLCGEVQAIRKEIDKALTNHRADLKQAEDGCRALEELLLRLQAEHHALAGACEQEVADLRGGVLGLTVQLVRQERHKVPSLSLKEVEGYAIEVSESWKETFLLYQCKIEELEDMVRASGESLHGVEEEKRQHVLQIGELQRDLDELDRIRLSLEDELRNMKEKFIVEVEEYQIIIESLEDEKQSLALTISDRLKDYHELMQAKTGLSLEVAAYRALLEGENNQEMFTWTEEQIRKIPHGPRVAASENSTNYSFRQGENARRILPAVHSSTDTRQQTRLSQIHSTVPRPRTNLQTFGAGSTVRKEVLVSGHRPPPAVRETASYQYSIRSQKESQNISGHGLSRQMENLRPVLPRERAAGFSVQESSSTFEGSSKNLRHTLQTDIPQTTKSKFEDNRKPKSYELSWELRGTKQVESQEQVMLNEKMKKEELSKVSEQKLPKKETKEDKDTKGKRSVALDEKPANEERGYAFEIKSKNIVGLERGNVTEEGLVNIDIPIKVMAVGSVNEKNESETRTQRERNFTVQEQIKSEGGNLAQEALRTIEIPIQVIGVRESRETAKRDIHQTLREINLFSNQAVKEDCSAAVKSDTESKEQICGVESTKNQTEEKRNEDLKTYGRVPISVQFSGEKQVSQNISTQITVDNSADSDAREHVERADESPHFNERESGPSPGDVNSRKHSSKTGTYWAEELSEHVTVADILKHVGQSTGLKMPDSTSPDSKVTYSESKQLADDGTLTTKIIVQSTTEEDFDLSDEEELEQLLNSSLEKTTLKHLKGMQAESFLENILHGGLKGKTSARVEITEEPMESATEEAGEYSVPFQVEEADDVSPGFQGKHGEEEETGHVSMAAEGFTDTAKPSKDRNHVEDVTEGGDTGEDIEYIVSTPDEFPMASGEQEDSLYGQIHIEEESRVHYWEDEFPQNSKHRQASTEMQESDSANQSCPRISKDVDDVSTHQVKENIQKREAANVEHFVIEKEIKMPQEFQTTLKGLFSKEIKDSEHQLKDALVQLEESLPGMLGVELPALNTQDHEDVNNLAVDIKKVEQTTDNGVVTIVAEINVSQTVEVDNLDLLDSAKSSPSAIEEALLQSLEEDASGSLKSHKKVSSRKSLELDVSPSKNNSMLWSSEQLYSSSKINNDLLCSTAEESLQERHASDPPDPRRTGEENKIQVPADMNTFVRHITLAPKEMGTAEHVIFEGPISEAFELGTTGNHSPTEGSTDMSRSVRHFKLSPMEIHTTRHFISEVSPPETLECSGDFPLTEGSTETSQFIRHIKLSPSEVSSEQIILEGPISEGQIHGGLSPTEGPADISTSIRHIKLRSKDFETTQQIVFEGPIQVSPENNEEKLSTNANRSEKHFKLSPTDIQMSEHIIFKGPLSHNVDSSGTQGQSDGGISTSIRHIALGSTTQSAEKITFEGPISEPSADGRSFVRHIKLVPKDFQSSEQIIFEGPISDMREVSPSKEGSTRHIMIESREIQGNKEVTIQNPVSERIRLNDAEDHQLDDSTEAGRSIRHIKLGPTEKSFTFSMDVTQFTTDPSADGGTKEATIVFPSVKLSEEPTTEQPGTANEGGQNDVEVENGGEIVHDTAEDYFQAQGQRVIDMSMFDKTIQLQRMVDQRSIISDDQKIAVVYLDHEEES